MSRGRGVRTHSEAQVSGCVLDREERAVTGWVQRSGRKKGAKAESKRGPDSRCVMQKYWRGSGILSEGQDPKTDESKADGGEATGGCTGPPEAGGESR